MALISRNPLGARWAATLVWVVALAGGCSSPLTTRPAEAVVSSSDGAPIAGAVVRADPIDPHHPLNISDYFRGEPGTLGSWKTDQSGHARITILNDRPTALSFAAAGFAPDSVLIDPEHPSPYAVTLQPVFPPVAPAAAPPAKAIPGKSEPQRP